MKVGIIGAMDLEVERLWSHMESKHVVEHLGMQFVEGTLDKVPAAVVMCGIGKVNAALCALALVEKFGVTHVINTGVGGSLDARINIGDIVVATDAVHHDMDVQALGYAPGQVPGMDVFSFPCDANMRTLAIEAVRETAPEVRAFEGRVASGDQFLASEGQKDRIVGDFGALCGEMEGAAIAHACYLAHIPCLVVRAISDKADGSAEMDYPTFKREAAARSARVIERLITLMR